jgi:hypothetical protein
LPGTARSEAIRERPPAEPAGYVLGDDPDDDRPVFVQPGRRFPWLALLLAAGVLLALAAIGARILFILFTLETLAH